MPPVVVVDPVDIDHSTLNIYSMANAEVAQRVSLDPPTNPSGTLVARGAVEDNEMSAGVQRGLLAGANEFVEFGRHESAIGHFHATLDERLARIATATAS